MKKIIKICSKIFSMVFITVLGLFRKLFHPKYWAAEYQKTVDDVIKIQNACGKDQISFSISSDIHYEPGRPNYTNCLKTVAPNIMNDCNLTYHIDLGDSLPQSNHTRIDNIPKLYSRVLQIFSKLDPNKLLMTIGNHDIASGKGYMFQLTTEQVERTFFKWQKASENKVFGRDGTYYYIDSPEKCTRFIVLNAFRSEWEGSSNGLVQDKSLSSFHSPRFGYDQLLWLAKEALRLPFGYSAIFCTHIPFPQSDSHILNEIIRAFNSKNVYTGQYDNSGKTIFCDFSETAGEIIAIFHGHYHRDRIDTETFSLPCISITAACHLDVLEKRVLETDCETAMDIVTIDKTNRRIYITRFGAGEDRSVNY